MVWLLAKSQGKVAAICVAAHPRVLNVWSTRTGEFWADRQPTAAYDTVPGVG